MVECLGRHTDTTILLCEDCGWRGVRKYTYHGYEADKHVTQDGELVVEAVPQDYCPICGSVELASSSEFLQ